LGAVDIVFASAGARIWYNCPCGTFCENLLNIIVSAITATGQNDKMTAYEKLTAEIIEQTGGFNIDGFKFKSKVEG